MNNEEAVDSDDAKSLIEKRKLELESERNRIERLKAWLTAFSIVTSILTVAATLIYGIVLENDRARASFEIKAVEIVLTAESPTAATNKAIVIDTLFPGRLPKHFKDEMIRLYGNSEVNKPQQ